MLRRIKLAWRRMSALMIMGWLLISVNLIDWYLTGKANTWLTLSLTFTGILCMSLLYRAIRTEFIDRLEMRFVTSMVMFKSAIIGGIEYVDGIPKKSKVFIPNKAYLELLQPFNVLDYIVTGDTITTNEIVLGEEIISKANTATLVYSDIMFNRRCLLNDALANNYHIPDETMYKLKLYADEANAVLVNIMIDILCECDVDYGLLSKDETCKLKSQILNALHATDL